MTQYKSYSIDELENHLSQFLINSWSYSKVSAFARNEKAFEMQYIYGMYGKSSSTTVAGQAYHYALKHYFNQMKNGFEADLVDIQQCAYDYIDDVPSNFWKLQKTTPTIDSCKNKATTTVTKLLENFTKEISVYRDNTLEVLDVEIYGDEYINVNGVDIPLPCHFVIDLVILTKDGKIVLVDHKSKSSYTSDEEIALSIGIQAITYVKGYESMTGKKVDEVWFVENKHSTNSNGDQQMNCFVVEMDANTRMLYEALLYEPLKRMIEAVNDADYVYLINESDNFIDKAELYDFWAKTMISEVDEFNVHESKKELVTKRLKKIRDSSSKMITPSIIKKFKEIASAFIQFDLTTKDMTQEQKIEHTLRSFGIIVRVAHIIDGYSSNTYLLEVSAGVKIASIFNYRLDIANALNVSNVRISSEMVVYEGRSYIGIDVSKKRGRNLDFDSKYLVGQKIPLGKDNYGNLIYWDFNNHSTPHALVCGATGSGKSVLIKNIIEYAKLAGVDEIVIFDPKYEFTEYSGSTRLRVINEIIDIEEEMQRLVDYMQELVSSKEINKRTLVVFDEFADAVANSRKGNDLKLYENVIDGHYANGMPKTKRICCGEHKSLEDNLRILLQKGRSAGFRVVAATQRASVKVITGDAKVNMPVQICFRVPKDTDSRVVLDEAGAETLAGQGDGLIKSPEFLQTIRFQAFYHQKSIASCSPK